MGLLADDGVAAAGGEEGTRRKGAPYRMIRFDRTPGGGAVVDLSLSNAYSFHDVLHELDSNTRGTWRKARERRLPDGYTVYLFWFCRC